MVVLMMMEIFKDDDDGDTGDDDIGAYIGDGNDHGILIRIIIITTITPPIIN